MFEAIEDAFFDTLKALPILYLVYLLVAFFSHKNILKTSKKTGPLVASALGQIPQCGFSGVMADLYSKRHITMGTLIAVFLATSDEALPVMLSEPNSIVTILVLLAIKFVCGVGFGYLVDYVLVRKRTVVPAKNLNSACHFSGIQEEEVDHCGCHHHQEHNEAKVKTCGHDKCADNIFLHALEHTLDIAFYLLVASLIINLLVYFIGIENISAVLVSNSIFQPLLVALIGLIPSCAISVLFCELFFSGVLSFGSLVAGLCAGAGLGLIILFTKNKNIKENLFILGMLYVFSAIIGMIVNLFEFYVI